MATIKDMIDLLCRCAESHQVSLPDDFCRVVTLEMRRRLGGERIYVPPVNSRNDPDRAAAILEAAKKLPTGVVRERFGVSRQLVHYHIKKGKNTDA